jgi:hypothetical protein
MDWLAGNYDDALRLVAERALARRGQVKEAAPDLSALLQDPTVRHGLLGAGIGAGAGVLAGGKGHRLKGGLLGALAGGAVGAGGTAIYKNMTDRDGKDKTQSQRAAEERSKNAIKAQSARSELGILGADTKKIDEAAEGVRSGKLSDSHARSGMHKAVPGSWKQFRNIPRSALVAGQQGRFEDVANQVDVPGLKNFNPFGRHFNLPTALAAGGAHQLAYHAHKLPGIGDMILKHRALRPSFAANESVRKILGDNGLTELRNLSTGQRPWSSLGAGEMRHIQEADAALRAPKEKPTLLDHAAKVHGGLGPSLAFLAPLLAREWLSRGGYRGGGQPINDLVQANKALSR